MALLVVASAMLIQPSQPEVTQEPAVSKPSMVTETTTAVPLDIRATETPAQAKQVGGSENWPVYDNHEFGFRIKDPPNFYVAEWNVGPPRLLYISFIDEKWRDVPGGVPSIELVVYANPGQQPLADWFSDRADVTDREDVWDGVFLDPAQRETTVLQNHPALKVRTSVMARLQRTFMAHGSYVLSLAYPPEDE